MSNLQEIENKLNYLKGRKEGLEKDKISCMSKLSLLSKKRRNVEEAQLLVQEVAKQTQQKLSDNISEIVTTALKSVLDDPYEFTIRYETKRGKTEALLLFKQGEKEIDPMDEAGGGVVDLASFALRIALWNISTPRSNNTIILDEPFKHLSKNYSVEIAKLLKMLSKKLKLQFIMVTHDENLKEAADKLFVVTKKKGISEVKEI